jgi:hypothetical protein
VRFVKIAFAFPCVVGHGADSTLNDVVALSRLRRGRAIRTIRREGAGFKAT